VSNTELEVRSFRTVFALDRRVYQIDTLRLNPTGVPLRGAAYAAVLIAAAVALGRVPGLAWVLAPLPWYLRDIVCPLGLAGLLAALRIEGRPFHVAAGAMVRHLLGPHHLRGLARESRHPTVWRPTPVVCIADGSESAPRAMRYRGPGVVLVCYAHDRLEWPRRSALTRRADLTISPRCECSSASPVALELAPGAVLEIVRRPLRGRTAERR